MGISVSVVLIVLGLAVLVWWRLRPKPVVVVSPAVAARHALEAVRNQPEDFALLSQVARTLRQYLAAVRHWDSAELAADELLARLAHDAWLGPELGAALVNWFRQSEARQFAPTPPSGPAAAVDRALELITRVEARRAEGNPGA